MKILRNADPQTVAEALVRPHHDLRELIDKVEPIFDRVARDGDQGVHVYTELFDQIQLEALEVSATEIGALAADVDADLLAAINLSAANIETFHNTQHRYEAPSQTMPGVKVWRRPIPLQRVGLYVPSGTASLISAVLMLGVPARLAGCQEILLATPPNAEGKLAAGLAAAARAAGVHRIFLMGGAQAIAAFAIGTQTVPRVDKIFGQGNQYVTAAKQLAAARGVAIDMPAGPAELLLVADDSAPLAHVAADLISHAEQGHEAQVVLLTTSTRIIAELEDELERQLLDLPRADTARQVLANAVVVEVASLQQALDISNRYAPQHLLLAVEDPEYLARSVQHAGTVLLGHYSPESAGHYATGTNHMLPAGGQARAYAGVSLDSFVRKITFQQLSRLGLDAVGKAVEVLAKAEGLEANARAVRIRFKPE